MTQRQPDPREALRGFLIIITAVWSILFLIGWWWPVVHEFYWSSRAQMAWWATLVGLGAGVGFGWLGFAAH